MRPLVLGALIFASFGLTAHAAEPPSDAKAVNQARRTACQWVTADRTLRLLRDASPGERRVATERPVIRAVSIAVKEPLVRVSRAPVRTASRMEPVRRAEPVRFMGRAEPIRAVTQHLSLMVGIGY
jgi:hypothetical protein